MQSERTLRRPPFYYRTHQCHENLWFVNLKKARRGGKRLLYQSVRDDTCKSRRGQDSKRVAFIKRGTVRFNALGGDT